MSTQILAMTFSSLFVAGAGASAWAGDQSTVDCSTAQQDISTLQDEKKSTDERKVKGIFAITPIGLVTNALTSGDKEMDPNQKMEIDEYNKKLDEHIAEIKKNCDVQEPENPVMQSN